VIWLKYISLAAPLITLILGWRQRFTLLWLYAAAGLICDNLGEVLKTHDYNYQVVGNIFVLLELLAVTLYYRSQIFTNKGMWMIVATLTVLLFVIYTAVNGILEMNFIGLGLLCVIYIVFGVLGYLKMMKDITVHFLGKLPFFWINTAFFLYAASTCILFIFVTYLKDESFDLMKTIWFYFFTVINILHYIFIGIGLYKTKPGEA
jgi:hypothetical protein